MEECEALCTRIAIMVNGEFKCLGSIQHLKNKFGRGFTLMAKVPYSEETGENNTEAFMQYIERTFPGSIVKSVHQGLLHYHITDASLSWAKLFGMMEAAKTEYSLENYSVSQTTLQQVFLNFAQAQIPPQEKQRNCCSKAKWFCRCCR